ncbi:hypothetical protein MAR_005658 [Mya arenaria]|uniref:Uncharacterized protein n=1 Tax=Mya arenaria TaxID=6604 RepID=A0ABY7F048_MYAAR|nr:hypothetical protein MAR_005658 [Mya arenaria]
MAEEEGDTKFVSKLDDASKQKCRDELNERNPADTLIAVQTLRQWVKEQDWLRTPTGKMDIKLIKDIGLDIFYKMSCLFYDWLTLDENVQANGVHALPVRTKSMNAYNEPAFFDVVYAFFSPFLSKKLKERVATPEFRRYVRELSSGKYGVDKNRIPAKSEAEGSYRKLNVD